jgi:hypothetical protein
MSRKKCKKILFIFIVFYILCEIEKSYYIVVDSVDAECQINRKKMRIKKEARPLFYFFVTSTFFLISS